MDLAAFIWTSVPDFAYDDIFLMFMENMQNCIFQTAPYRCGSVARSMCNLLIVYIVVKFYISMKVSPYFCIYLYNLYIFVHISAYLVSAYNKHYCI